MEHQPKSKDFIKALGEFFKRELISIPLIKSYPHQAFSQKCGLRAATLELDTSAFPNIEYIAGNRLSVYPTNPIDHVNAVLKHLRDDIGPHSVTNASGQARKRPKMSEPWSKFVHFNGKDSLKLALLYLYDITTAPSRDLLRVMAESCSNKEHKNKLLALCKSDDIWEKWVCQSPRTLRSTFEEFNSCSMSAQRLISELTLQQPRQYSISSIKSSKRFRTEIIVFQHKFTKKHIFSTLTNIKEHEKIFQQAVKSPSLMGPYQTHPTTVHVATDDTSSSQKSSASVRSLRSMVAFGTSPITTQQVKRVPSYSGPVMSNYAATSISSLNKSNSQTSARKSVISQAEVEVNPASGSNEKQYDGLCSNYLLNLNPNDYIVCEFVENPRFTLKGNRERPIMMVGQDVGLVAFRPFWQQRALEYDRAQIFYTMFKDLSPKKFGEMHLVCLTGNRCKVEDLFKKEINFALANKILSTSTNISRNQLAALLDSAAASNNSGGLLAPNVRLHLTSKELLELGNHIAKLLVDSNGCLYTCCDPQMTQAIEILIVESVARIKNLSRDRIMTLLPKWKGRKMGEQPLTNNKFLFTMENPFERSQIVHEIYDFSI